MKLYKSILPIIAIISLSFIGYAALPTSEFPKFTLTNQLGQKVNEDVLKGKYTVINFIFTRCQSPNMCPASTKRMADLQDKVASYGLKDVQFITVTFDPEFDTPEVLKTYSQAYKISSDNYHFLTDTAKNKSQIDKLMRYASIAAEAQDGTINHSINVLVIAPDRKTVLAEQGPDWSADKILAYLKSRQTNPKPSPTTSPSPAAAPKAPAPKNS